MNAAALVAHSARPLRVVTQLRVLPAALAAVVPETRVMCACCGWTRTDYISPEPELTMNGYTASRTMCRRREDVVPR